MENLTLNDLQIKLIYAQNFSPHKVEYYKQLIREKIEQINIFNLNP